jgi:hypothetical protein
MRTLFRAYNWIYSHRFEALVIASFLAILILALFRWNKSGTWSKDYFYLPPVPSSTAATGAPRPPRKDSSGELRTRAFLERRFNRPFPKSRPDFMVNPVTGSQYNLELDCYNEELRLAVEYHGQQHYHYIPFFHKSKEAFYNQRYRDELKRLRCRDLGITLIEVPYTQQRDLETFLEQELRRVGR